VTSAPLDAHVHQAAFGSEKIVVDPGFVVDPVDLGTPNQPRNPHQPRNSWIIVLVSE
jgi:hypothetical protein